MSSYNQGYEDASRRFENRKTMNTMTLLRSLDDAKEDLAEYRKWLKRVPKVIIGGVASGAAGFAVAATFWGEVAAIPGMAAGFGGVVAAVWGIILGAIHLDEDHAVLKRAVRHALHDYDDALTRRAEQDAKESEHVRTVKSAS